MWNQSRAGMIALTKAGLLALAIGFTAWMVGKQWPVIGAPLAAILLGALLAPLAAALHFTPWFKGASRKLLLASVVMLGFEMDFTRIINVGQGIAGFMCATVVFALAAAWVFARLLKLTGNTAILVGVGTSICGGSAIMAVAGVTQAKDDEVVQALSTIFLFNILAAALFPVAGHILGLDQLPFGLWAGTAINDTSSVLAATFTYGEQAARFGMVVKLTRTLMILPVSLGLLAFMRFQGKSARHWQGVIPWPVLGFVAAAAIHLGMGNTHEALWHMTALTGRVLMVLALVCIGLVTHLGEIWHKGRRALGVGALTWLALSVFSLTMVKFTFRF